MDDGATVSDLPWAQRVVLTNPTACSSVSAGSGLVGDLPSPAVHPVLDVGHHTLGRVFTRGYRVGGAEGLGMLRLRITA